MCNDGIIGSDWADKLERLLSRQKKILTKTIPRLSNGVIITFLVAVFTPIAQAVADAVEGWCWKAAITATPLLIGLIIYFVASYRAKKLLSPAKVYAIYKDQELSNETHSVISEKEPSAREFRKWMNDLSEALLSDKKLVVVFDNMDRLPSDKVRDIWSSIHTFFAEEPFENIWAIVSFDSDHMATVFKSQGKKASREFLKKSFPIIYRVAPPVLTDWKKFFDLKFKEAFGESENDELVCVRKLFDHFQKEITPRNIIAFINEMVSFRLSVEKEIRLRYIAVFALAKQDILKDPVSRISDPHYLTETTSVFEGDINLADNIAALAYQVPLASASQVALMREIRNSLNTRNDQEFNKLAKHQHFLDILEQVVTDDDIDIDRAVATIAKIDPNVVPSHELTDIWDDLCKKEIRKPLSEQQFTKTHELLLAQCSAPQIISLVKYLVCEIKNAEDFSGAMYYQALSKLDACLHENNLDVDMLSMVSDINKPPETFLDYVRVAKSEYEKFKVKCDPSGLQEQIIQRIPDNLAGLSALSAVTNDYDFDLVIGKLEEEVASNSLTYENVGSFYQLYRALATKKPIEVMEPHTISNLLNQVQSGSAEEFDLLVMCLAKGISQSVLEHADEDQISRIAERIEYYEDYGTMLLHNLDWRNPILKAALTKITMQSHGTSRLAITEILKRYSEVLSSLDVTPQDFIKRLDGWSKFAEEEITSENVLELISDHELFEHAVQTDCDLACHLIETIGKVLVSLDIDEWQNHFQDETSFIFQVTCHLLAAEKFKLPDNAIIAYRKILVLVAKNEFQVNDDYVWHVLYDKTHKSKLKPTAKNIRDIYISDVGITSDKFLFFSDLLLQHGALEQRSGDVVRKILTPVSEHNECLMFIINNNEKFIPILNDAGDDAEDFKDIIRQHLDDPDVSSELKRFAGKIKVRRRRQ